MISLRRITSGGRFIPEIDGLRFVAIAWVVWYHFHGFLSIRPDAPAPPAWTGMLAGHGYRGVNLFYVLSGFLLGMPFAASYFGLGEPVRLSRYFLRRVTRLEVPYIVNLLLCFAVAVVWNQVSAAGLVPHLAASVLYVHNAVYGAASTINNVAWTLEVEVQFYCLAPVLASVFRIGSTRVRRAVLIGGILLIGAAQLLAWDSPMRVKLSLLFAIQFFLAGFLLADLYLLDWKRQPGRSGWWDGLAVLVVPVLVLAGDREAWLVLPLLLLVLCAAAFRGVVLRRMLTWSVVTTIGGMCYTIYLWHYVIIPPILAISPAWMYLPVLALITLVYFAVVERPCMSRDWPLRLAQRIGLIRKSASQRPGSAAGSSAVQSTSSQSGRR